MKIKDQINFLTAFIDRAGFTKSEMQNLNAIREQLLRINKGGRPRIWESEKERWAYYNARRKKKQ